MWSCVSDHPSLPADDLVDYRAVQISHLHHVLAELAGFNLLFNYLLDLLTFKLSTWLVHFYRHISEKLHLLCHKRELNKQILCLKMFFIVNLWIRKFRMFHKQSKFKWRRTQLSGLSWEYRFYLLNLRTNSFTYLPKHGSS